MESNQATQKENAMATIMSAEKRTVDGIESMHITFEFDGEERKATTSNWSVAVGDIVNVKVIKFHGRKIYKISK